MSYRKAEPTPTWADVNGMPLPAETLPRVTTYEEWRVTGTTAHGARALEDWSEIEDNDCEGKARRFAAWAEKQGWTDGPHLHKRTVTVPDWEDA